MNKPNFDANIEYLLNINNYYNTILNIFKIKKNLQISISKYIYKVYKILIIIFHINNILKYYIFFKRNVQINFSIIIII